MAVDCSWAHAQLEGDASLLSLLPNELLDSIRNESGSQYLDAIASATLLPGCTDKLSAYYKELLPEISARWLLNVETAPFNHHLLVLCSLSKILPFAPYLKSCLKELLGHSTGLSCFANVRINLYGLDDDQLYDILLAFFRLLTYDVQVFKPFLHPALLPPFFQHKLASIQYLAVQCFSQVMGLADALTTNLITKHIGEQAIRGSWEGQVIDLKLVKLHEERRWKRQESLLSTLAQQPSKFSTTQRRLVRVDDLMPETASLGGVLIPRLHQDSPATSSLVQTPTTTQCLREVGLALLRTRSVLLNGESGSGKTSLVLEAARLLGKSSSLITLHLNEQTDAKSLLGLHTSSEETGSFIWQPGVLTQAMRAGNWVLVEDIDKAPLDLLGLLRSVLQDGELYLPSRKEYLRAADGFRIFATTRTSGKSPHLNFHRNSWIFSDRYWSIINIPTLTHAEIHDILSSRFPSLDHLISSMMDVHRRVKLEYRKNHALRSITSRSPSLRDLLKWCRRTLSRLEHSQPKSDISISEATKLNIFRDAVDCYAGHLATHNSWSLGANCIAEQMHIAPQHAQHCIQDDIPRISDTKANLEIGRAKLHKSMSLHHKRKRLGPFAFTRQVCMNMAKIAAATSQSEAVLLVGETGVGKTTLVQHIAGLLGQSLVVVNLSQQSEASDLMGNLKPVTTRSLMVPAVDQFSILFDDTFSDKKNMKFLSAMHQSVGHENWHRVLMLWQQAMQKAEVSLAFTPIAETSHSVPQTAKRRRLDTPKHKELRDRWIAFSESISRLQVQVERAERNLTFAYVEGRIVQAVREGSWLLLDEINLASSDTLDSIASLLGDIDQERPYLHLTESGNAARVTAHPDFRVFAAMNPATDTGKKDLSPGIRSGFTEIYVHAGDTELKDLVSLIETYLDGLLDSDKRVASDLANLYLAIKTLNHEHQIVDGAGDDPHFTIRSLVRCLLYIQKHAAIYGLRRAVFEGAHMSFCTMLSCESERIILPLINQHVLSEKRSHAFLTQHPRLPSDEVEYVSFKHHLVMKGCERAVTQPHYIRTPSVERNLLNLARAASMHRFPILLQGPTSSGKTSMVEYLAKSTGNLFVRVNNHEHTDLQEYLGSYASSSDGKLEFREGVLVQALRRGHWIVLDELNLAPSDVLEALNRLLDDNRELLIPETQEVVRPHPGFMLFATQNPAGLYGGRKRLSRAFRNRFLELHFDDIPEDELEIILQQRSKIAPSYCTQIVAVYKRLSLQRQSSRLFEQQNSFATLRDLFRWSSRQIDDRTQLANQGFMLLGERVRNPAERQIVKEIIEEVVKVKIDLSALYDYKNIPASLRAGSVIWTPAMRRLFVLASTALQNNEPVLLVGETGCGKTQICQSISQSFKRHLNVYNAHTNTETGDLIGSLRPARHKAEVSNELKGQLLHLLHMSSGERDLEEEPLEALIERFDQLETSALEEQTLADVRSTISMHKSLFEWVDGSLVRAMKKGEHFLLDEISLADDSVLERLNSVLEPSRTILLAEKGPEENFVIADPGFQFLATMNPGGDYGKRELSAALRNRLTEIWAPQLVETDDVLPILESKLSPNLQPYANQMLDFSRWYKCIFVGAETEAVPLRDLITWADFLQQSRQLDAGTAFYHGAAMVFIDSLGANPAGIMSSATDNVMEARALCVEKLRQTIANLSPSIYNQEVFLAMTENELHVGPFVVKREADSPGAVEIVFGAPTTVKNTMRLLRALQMKRSILLEGSPGVGKTAIVTALAEVMGKQLTRINLSEQTDLMDLFGADVPIENEDIGKFGWNDGPLLRAMQDGGWVLLDEMNLASQSVLEGLNSCLDHRQEVYIAELDRSFICHPDFKLFGAQNPHYQGGGRKGLPKSFINRFTVVYAERLENQDLYQICTSKFPSIDFPRIKAVVDVTCKIQEIADSSADFGIGGPWEFNLRDVSRWLQLLQQTPSLGAGYHFEMLLSQRLRRASQKGMVEKLRHSCFANIHEASLYHSLSPKTFQVGTAFLCRNTSWQKVRSCGQPLPAGFLPYAQSLIHAVNHKWPVIIADGMGGSSAAMLVRELAAIAGVPLMTISLNADTDAVDLIGSLEQHEPYRDLMAVTAMLQRALREELLGALKGDDLAGLPAILDLYSFCEAPAVSLETLQARIKELSKTSDGINHVLHKIEQLLSQPSGRKTGFIWNDGILVDALREGRWLVLENANTCNPAVLDRLNSLLEPSGVLTLSEQHNCAESSRIIQPHPNFRIFLTMDPRQGELSRAMRNRSLELFVGEIAFEETESSAIGYSCTADVYRIRHLENLNMDDVDHGMQSLLVSTFLDHSSESDRGLLEGNLAWSSLRSNKEALLHNHLKTRASLSSSIQDQTRTIQLQLLGQAHMDEARLIHYLPLPAVNQPLMDLSSDHNLRTRAERHTWAYRILLRIHAVRDAVYQVSKELQIIDHKDSNLLQKSLVHKKGDDIGYMPFAEFLVATSTSLQAIVESIYDTGYDIDTRLMRYVESLSAFLENILCLSGEYTLGPGVIAAYLQTGRELVSKSSTQLPALYHVLSQALDLFAHGSQLNTGRSLHIMWDSFRPLTASTERQLKDLLAVETFIERLDNLSISVDSLPNIMNAKQRLLEVYGSVLAGSINDEHFFLDLDSLITALEVPTCGEIDNGGHFNGAFELIRQLSIASNMLSPSDFSTSLTKSSTLLDHASAAGRSMPGALVAMLGMINISSADGPWNAWQDKFGLALIQKISTTEAQPISSMKWLQTEVRILLQQLSYLGTSFDSGTILYGLRDKLHNIVMGTLSCHNDLLDEQDRIWISRKDKMDARLHFAATLPPDHYFRTIYEDYLHDPITWLGGATSTISLQHTGAAFVAVSLGLLRLLVPDQPYDPALTSQVAQTQFKRRHQAIQDLLIAQKIFEENFTGQKTSLLVRMTEAELLSIGVEPVVAAVVRMPGKGLNILAVEFTNLLRAIVDKLPEKILLAGVPGRWQNDSVNMEDIRAEAEDLVLTIEHVLNRLKVVDRTFDDLTKPITWIMQCLALGAQMLAAHQSSWVSRLQHIQRHADKIPLLGSIPEKIMSWPVPVVNSLEWETENYLDWLEHFAIVTLIEQHDWKEKGSMFRHLFIITESMYDAWKTHLRRDKDAAVVKSRYYAYRGDEDLDESQEKQAVIQMFPTFDEEEQTCHENATARDAYASGAFAAKLAKVQHRLFCGDNSRVDLESYIDLLLSTLSGKAGQQSSELGLLQSQDLVPLIILKFERMRLNLDATKPREHLNIYTDGDVFEARKLDESVKSIMTNFRRIHEAWPEHALPMEVLDFCREVSRFSLEVPVAKLLTKTEKLLDIVSQWQAIASREYSAAENAEDLKKLIIRWRQLELSSWSRLLDLEQRKVEESAQSWYFMLYEAIIYTPRQILDREQDLQDYVKELARTLEEFLTLTSLGEFSYRLQLCQSFEGLLGGVIAQDPMLRSVLNCLTNTITHHERYLEAANLMLAKGRTELEKKLEEQVKLASWKDTNVSALRESARRSHFKLFKIVRKYRVLLSQTLQLPITTNHGAEPLDSVSDVSMLSTTTPPAAVKSALQIVSESVPEWSSRPERLRNPLGAATRMKMLIRPQSNGFIPSDELSQFTSSLLSSMKDLRIRTPTTTTEDNGSLINHLKSLKQILLSDTLRKLKQMGVRRDVGSREMEKQISRAVVLATVPCFVSKTQAQVYTDVSDDFHEVLDLMPIVRGALNEHSEQVRVVDIRRSVSYADGLLSILIQQRKAVATCEHNLSTYSELVKKLGSFALQSIDHFKHSPPSFQSKKKALTRRLCWLPKILEVSIKVLRIQDKHSDAELDGVIDSLLVVGHTLSDHTAFIRASTPLPQGIRLKSEHKLMEGIDDLLSNTRHEIETAIFNHPKAVPVLRTLLPWMDMTTVELELDGDDSHELSLDAFDRDLRDCLDIIFETVQQVSSCSERMPNSTETGAWLAKSCQRQAEMMHMLQIPDVNKKFAFVELSLARLSSNELRGGISLMVAALPILEQYLMICQYVSAKALALHQETARMTVVLAKTLTTIAAEGFCNPQEPSKDEEQSGPVESGTGLGDGTGAEDISKHVGEDEDLSELAQMENEKLDGQELGASKDAVNMDKDELKGDDGVAEDSGVDDNRTSQSEDEDGSDLEEETGSVDKLDPLAVDEKMWEGLDAEKDKELEMDKTSGEKSNEQTAKREQYVKGHDEQQQDAASNDDADDNASDIQEGGEEVGSDEIDQADATLREEKPLDLPDEMQLNGTEKVQQDDLSDDEMANLSDIEDEPGQVEPEQAELGSGEEEEQDLDDAAVDDVKDVDGNDKSRSEDVEEDGKAEMTDERNHDVQNDDTTYDIKDDQVGEQGNGGYDEVEENDVDVTLGRAAMRSRNQAQEQPQNGAEDEGNDNGMDESGGGTRGGHSKSDFASPQEEALWKLGDMLERWHQRRGIHQATQDHAEQAGGDVNMAETDFEHLLDDEDRGDTQALGIASKEQAQALDQSKAVEDHETHGSPNLAPADVENGESPMQENIVERLNHLTTNSDRKEDSTPGAIMPDRRHEQDVGEQHKRESSMDHEALHEDNVEEQLKGEPRDHLMTLAEASQLWSHYSAKVQRMSLILTEQLRLILAPTLATKLRGDFRTGKRLNIKRIIPYIASGYKRDKIWMRRSVPSKRNYQIMLALDDSRSMMEGGAGTLAFETLAMLCKSLSMLEAGDLCVVGFGNEEHIRVAHPFGRPFGNEAGVQIFQNFTFNQAATDVRTLIKESIGLFRDARAKSTSSQRDLWQMQLIVSDGICEDHENISRLVRQAKEEKIMIVFVIVDGAGDESILDLKQVNFEPDETGEMKLSMRRYLDKFPFPYYLVVRDVRDLPAVLATALKGWFAQVVDVQG